MQKLTLATIIGTAVLSLVPLVKAQQVSDRYINVGWDANGNPTLLDLQSIQGTSYKLVTRSRGNRLTIMSFTASCETGRLTMNLFALYDSDGNLISQDTQADQVAAQPGSAIANAMRLVCEQQRSGR